PYLILTTDKPDSLARRNALRAAHLEYLDRHRHRLLAAGALLNDDGSGGHGGAILLDTDARQEAEDFIAHDPFALGGLFESTTLTRWRKAYFNGERLV
ncbi:MAG: YciI family protein, partial [Phycisphaerales bacterium]|nr:YciI family protein [Phycisphaerales bacterium]